MSETTIDDTKFFEEMEDIVEGGTEEPQEEQQPAASIVVPLEVIEIIRNAPSGEKILSSCIDLAIFLSQKNTSYGNSALDPVRIFSKANSTEQLLVRIDDKISRLMRGEEFAGDDTLRDLLGYLLLYFVAQADTQRVEQENAQKVESE